MNTDVQKAEVIDAEVVNAEMIHAPSSPCSSVSSLTSLLPLPALPIEVRVATLADLPFIDALQKKHSKALGFFPRAQIEGYIRGGWMLIAEEAGVPIGYIASRDRYLKRDELGAIFQLCVEPGRQRGLIGATLLKAAFDRAAYGCKLFCCWCAQDLAANHFWEAMGFQAIAFRTGSRTKGKAGAARVHIFWQKRIRAGDTGDPARGGTPWWYPFQTSGGSIREDRIVLPIPPGVHWSEAKPIVLPDAEGTDRRRVGTAHQLETKTDARTPRTTAGSAAGDGGRCPPYGKMAQRPGGIFFAPVAPVSEPTVASVPVKAKREPRERSAMKAKHDPLLVARARELRDRWLEQVNEVPTISHAKYDLTRSIDGRKSVELIEPAATQLAA